MIHTFPIFDAGHLLLREIQTTDVDDMFHYYGNCEMMKNTRSDTHQTKDETLTRIQKLSHSLSDNRGIAWAIVEKDRQKAIGSVKKRPDSARYRR